MTTCNSINPRWDISILFSRVEKISSLTRWVLRTVVRQTQIFIFFSAYAFFAAHAYLFAYDLWEIPVVRLKNNNCEYRLHTRLAVCRRLRGFIRRSANFTRRDDALKTDVVVLEEQPFSTRLEHVQMRVFHIGIFSNLVAEKCVYSIRSDLVYELPLRISSAVTNCTRRTYPSCMVIFSITFCVTKRRNSWKERRKFINKKQPTLNSPYRGKF